MPSTNLIIKRIKKEKQLYNSESERPEPGHGGENRGQGVVDEIALLTWMRDEGQGHGNLPVGVGGEPIGWNQPAALRPVPEHHGAGIGGRPAGGRDLAVAATAVRLQDHARRVVVEPEAHPAHPGLGRLGNRRQHEYEIGMPVGQRHLGHDLGAGGRGAFPAKIDRPDGVGDGRIGMQEEHAARVRRRPGRTAREEENRGQRAAKFRGTPASAFPETHACLPSSPRWPRPRRIARPHGRRPGPGEVPDLPEPRPRRERPHGGHAGKCARRSAG